MQSAIFSKGIAAKKNKLTQLASQVQKKTPLRIDTRRAVRQNNSAASAFSINILNEYAFLVSRVL